MNKKSFTLLEIIISLVILALTMAGLTNLFISGKRWLLHGRSRMAGGELGKYFLDDFQMDVRQDQWGKVNNCLKSDPRTGCPGTQTINNITYTPQYTITNDYPITNLNKVKVDITWPKD